VVSALRVAESPTLAGFVRLLRVARATAIRSNGCPSQLAGVTAQEHCRRWPAHEHLVMGAGGCAKNGEAGYVVVPLASGRVSADRIAEYVALWSYDLPTQNPPPNAPWLFTASGGPHGSGSGPYGSPEQAWSTKGVLNGGTPGAYHVPKGHGAWGIGGGSGCAAASTVHAWVVIRPLKK